MILNICVCALPELDVLSHACTVAANATNPLKKLRNIVSLFICILQLNGEGLNTGAVHCLLMFFYKMNNFLRGGWGDGSCPSCSTN